MEDIMSLLTIDYSVIFASVLTILIGIQGIATLFEWNFLLCKKYLYKSKRRFNYIYG